MNERLRRSQQTIAEEHVAVQRRHQQVAQTAEGEESGLQTENQLAKRGEKAEEAAVAEASRRQSADERREGSSRGRA